MTKYFLLFIFISWEVPGSSVETFLSMAEIENSIGKQLLDKLFAIHGELIEKHLLKNKTVLTIIDYRKPSKDERLYVIDTSGNLLFKDLVAHGIGSEKEGKEGDAVKFSNLPGSEASSLGILFTDDTGYYGEHGYSLKLKGLERGINDNAMKRAIVLHGAWYVSPEFAKQYGRLGRSLGCPAVSDKNVRKIIDLIKGGSLFFILGKGEEYFKQSTFFKN